MINGCHLLALSFAVAAVMVTVAVLASRRDRTPTAADNRKAHERDTAARAAEAAHRAQTGGTP